jgi:hypothetical protein
VSAPASVADEHDVLVGDGGLSRGEVFAMLETGFSSFTVAGASFIAYDPG